MRIRLIKSNIAVAWLLGQDSFIIEVPGVAQVSIRVVEDDETFNWCGYLRGRHIQIINLLTFSLITDIQNQFISY